MNASLIHQLERTALEVARRGAVAHDVGAFDVEPKNGFDVVTSVDLAAEAAMVDFITDQRPNDSIIGEEGTGVVGDNDVMWVLDPLDGTANFTMGAPYRSVSVGLRVEGSPAVGVVIDTGRGDEFTGSVSSPARRNGELIRVKPADLAHAILSTGFSPDPARRAQQAAVIAGLLPQIRDIRRGGSPALDLCGVACGWTHGFFEGPLGSWDYTAGQVIVKAAGGDSAFVFDGSHDLIVAGSRPLVDGLARLLSG